MTNFWGEKRKLKQKKLYIKEKIQLVFSSKIKVPQLGSARLGTFIARARSSRKIPARTHHYYLPTLISVYTKIYINFRTPCMKCHNPTEIDIYFLLWNWKKACKKKGLKDFHK